MRQPGNFLGIPVEYNDDSAHIACARGVWMWRRIVIGPKFLSLDSRTQQAVLFHEADHIIRFHREQRFAMCCLLAIPGLLLLSWQTIAAIVLTGLGYFFVERFAQLHELSADEFAARNGFGVELLHMVRAAGPPPILPVFYPDYQERCASLVRAIKEREHAETT